MKKRKAKLRPIGTVISEAGREYTVTLTPRQNIVVVVGADNEWRWPLSEYQPLNPAHSILFHRVASLLQQASLI